MPSARDVTRTRGSSLSSLPYSPPYRDSSPTPSGTQSLCCSGLALNPSLLDPLPCPSSRLPSRSRRQKFVVFLFPLNESIASALHPRRKYAAAPMGNTRGARRTEKETRPEGEEPSINFPDYISCPHVLALLKSPSSRAPTAVQIV